MNIVYIIIIIVVADSSKYRMRNSVQLHALKEERSDYGGMTTNIADLCIVSP